MIRPRDNWERLVEAVVRREQLRQIALSHSRSPSTSSLDSDYSFTFSSPLDKISIGSSTKSPFHSAILAANSVGAEKQSGSKVLLANRRNKWKGLGIFTAFTTKKKDYGIVDERAAQWASAQRTLHGLKPPETTGSFNEKRYSELSQITEEVKRRAEIARFRELGTLKGHLESIIKNKGLDIEKIQKHYTV